ncbi:hypothetical protein B5807_05426 [Epicoccum nigrum]|uniref:BTB domain-containing protein n=1 Tax=Epicoccum nigrum TaxID=105696 RepID=A0A1Y2M1J6_EPING|nr:hypothetical protein B5807_05426 [Epicoccum nigrum]
MSTPQASEAARAFYEKLEAVSDLELQISDLDTITAHSAVLAQKSLWFKDICVKSNRASKQTVRLPDLERDTFMHFFSPELSIDDKRRGAALTAMLLFCYTGSYGQPIASIVLREQYESTMSLHMYEYLLARLYGIESLEAYSLKQIKSMAAILQALRSETYYTTLVNILCYDGFEAKDSLVQFASAEFMKLNDARVQRTWPCITCDTLFRVSYLKRPGTAARFVLDRCPNCAEEALQPPMEVTKIQAARALQLPQKKAT